MDLSNVKIARWSVEDYHSMIKSGILDDRAVELLEGEIVEMSPESPLHTVYGEGLANYLRTCLSAQAWIREARPITLLSSEPEPDIAIVKLPWFQYREHHPYPEDIYWLVEISDSTLHKDLTEKQKIYAQARILEYWVLDVKAKKVIIFREPNHDSYSIREEVSQGNITPLAFPQIKIPLEKVFSGEILN